MIKFEIAKEFLINDKPIKIRSGAVHYFRIAESQWKYTLEKMKAAGLNTVETYIPWNVHESEEGTFNFDGQYSIKNFIKLAEEVGLFVIVRPSPYICAEWEFGGLPAWLLKYPDMVVRTNTEPFMNKVDNYYKELFKQLVPLQYTYGGPILMMQVENEYGSFGNDKEYLRHIKLLMQQNGVNVPFFTSDGSWYQALASGSLIEDNVLVTANFGSHVVENFNVLRDFMDKYDKKWPLMCMEFWDGWFNRWNDDIIKRETNDFKTDLKKLVDLGANFNLYMFRGGSNWGFYNGCSSRKGIDLPQVTSYDYDAILHEDGTENEKYGALCDILNHHNDILDSSIKIKKIAPILRSKKLYLFDVLDTLANKIESVTPRNLEEIGNGYGYILYQTTITGEKKLHNEEELTLVGVSDRAEIYLNNKKIETQYQDTLGKPVKLNLTKKNKLEILVENMGRVNYGNRLLSETQKKGIRSGVMIDRHFHYGWTQWAFDFNNLNKIDWDKEIEQTHGPTLNKFEFILKEGINTYLDCSDLGKGSVIVNGVNIGKYWSVGPVHSLYIPSDILNVGKNTIIVVETTDKNIDQIKFITNQLF